MVDDLSDHESALRDLEARVSALESGTPFENASVTNGSVRFIGGTLRVEEDGRVEIVGTLSVEGQASVSGPLTISGELNVTGPATISETLHVGGDTTIDGTLDIGAETTLDSSLTVVEGGSVTVDGDLPATLESVSNGGVSLASLSFPGARIVGYRTSLGEGLAIGPSSGSFIKDPSIFVMDDKIGISATSLPSGRSARYLVIDDDGYIYAASRGGGGDPDPGDPPAGNPDGYIWPADPAVYGISDDFAAHVARGSAEPGVDVMTPVGAPLWSPASGTILAVQTSPAGATGRYVTLITDEGDWFRFLHNSSVVVSAGQRVEQAQLLAYTGGSGFGSEAYYGPHTHISFKVGYTGAFPGAAALDDFEAYMADA